jgi:homoserine kinase
MIAKCAQKVIAMCTGDEAVVPLRLTVHSEVPMGCGCGSSSAAAVAGILAGFALAGSPKVNDKAEILRLATEIEGHPDNAAPAIYGGLQLVYAAVPATAAPRSMTIPLPAGLKVVVFVPHKAMKASTHQMRGLIPTQVSMGDAVHNMGRTAVIVAALALNQTERLAECMDDRFHQPQRATVYPHVRPCMDAAVAAGACYAFLSGAGPSVAAFIMAEDPAVHEAVVREMDKAALSAGVEGACIITTPAAEGAHVMEVPLC